MAVFQYLRGVIDSVIGQHDIDSAVCKVGELLDKTLFTEKRDKVFERTLDLAINHLKWAA